MMGFFMPCYRKTKRILSSLILLFGLILGMSSAFAASQSAIHVKSAELTQLEDNYVLNSDLDISFSPFIEDVLGKGIPLTFLVEVQLSTPKKY